MPTGFSSGIYPYLGGSASIDQIRTVMSSCGGAVVSGMGGARVAAKVQGTLVDPARYAAPPKDTPESLIDLDEWLERQRAAGVPVILTDTSVRGSVSSGIGRVIDDCGGLGVDLGFLLRLELVRPAGAGCAGGGASG
jgi:hypothetical protein